MGISDSFFYSFFFLFAFLFDQHVVPLLSFSLYLINYVKIEFKLNKYLLVSNETKLDNLYNL